MQVPCYRLIAIITPIVVRIRLSDLEKEPRQGMRMWIGSELYKISEVTTEYNELIIELVGEDE